MAGICSVSIPSILRSSLVNSRTSTRSSSVVSLLPSASLGTEEDDGSGSFFIGSPGMDLRSYWRISTSGWDITKTSLLQPSRDKTSSSTW